MKTSFPKTAGIVAVTLAAIVGAAPAFADEHEHDHDRHERHEFERHEPYRAEHWIYDNRHDHGHYYPSIGYSVSILPPGFLSLNFSNRRFFFNAGVWYAPAAGGYVVARPPLGIAVPVLPPAYTTVWVGGVPYYYANDIYYRNGPGGYVVVEAPAEGSYTQAPPPPAPAPQAAPPQAPGMWYYCDAARAYYPYVSTCPAGWRAVPASAPPR